MTSPAGIARRHRSCVIHCLFVRTRNCDPNSGALESAEQSKGMQRYHELCLKSALKLLILRWDVVYDKCKTALVSDPHFLRHEKPEKINSCDPKLMIRVWNWSLWSVLFVYAIKQIFHFWHIPYSSGTGHKCRTSPVTKIYNATIRTPLIRGSTTLQNQIFVEPKLKLHRCVDLNLLIDFVQCDTRS
jgi:hypothetical protein